MDKRAIAAYNLILDLVEEWQNEGRNGHCMPVIRGAMLEGLEQLANERRTENCKICDGEGIITTPFNEYPCECSSWRIKK